MTSNGVWQLKSIHIFYSETGHSSRGIRYYFRYLLDRWKTENNPISIETTHKQFEEPRAIFTFFNDTHSVSLKDLTPRQIEDVFNLYKNSHSSNKYLKHGGPRVWTQRRSIQGLWQPSLEGQMKALQVFHKPYKPLKIPKYTEDSLKLSIQCVRGYGRWGNEREFPKGFDQLLLKDILGKPLINLNSFKENNKNDIETPT